MVKTTQDSKVICSHFNANKAQMLCWPRECHQILLCELFLELNQSAVYSNVITRQVSSGKLYSPFVLNLFFCLGLHRARCWCLFDSCLSVSFFLSLFCSGHWPYFCQLKSLIALSSFLFHTDFSISVGRSQSSQRSQVIFTWPDQSTLLACLSFSPHTYVVFWLLLIVSCLRVGKQQAYIIDISDDAFALSDISSGMLWDSFILISFSESLNQ